MSVQDLKGCIIDFEWGQNGPEDQWVELVYDDDRVIRIHGKVFGSVVAGLELFSELVPKDDDE